MATDVASDFPQSIRLPDGSQLEIRLMGPGDKEAVLAFARSLPEEDLLFLRVDITEERVVDDWLANLASGRSTSLVVFDADGLVGYATVHRNPAPWTRGVGELRVNVAPAYRGRGLGRILTARIFDLAQGLRLRKLMANMTADQHGAQAAFRHLGFVPEALLADYVEDREGIPRDLVIMSYTIDGHTDRAAGPLKL